MKTTRIPNVVAAILSIATISLFTATSHAQKPASKKKLRAVEAVKIKPDLVVKNLKITKLGEDGAGGDRVKITAMILNTRSGTSTGPFKVKIDWTENPRAGWNRLHEAGVVGLTCSPASSRIPSAVVSANHVVPPGKAYKYRVTADSRTTGSSRGDVDESNETNNVESAGYVER